MLRESQDGVLTLGQALRLGESHLSKEYGPVADVMVLAEGARCPSPPGQLGSPTRDQP